MNSTSTNAETISMPKTALIITTYNRPELLKQCLDSLRNADLSKVNEVIIVDDHSTDHNVAMLIGDFIHHNGGVYFRHTHNTGIKEALMTAYQFAFRNCDLAINLDPDTIVKSNFVTTLLQLKQQHPDSIISGFNCNHPQNPVISSHDGYVLRKHCNGINMLIDKQQYETVIKPALQSNGNWDYNSTHTKPFVISKPSVVQHIGINQSTMGHAGGDVACDFKLLSLPNVCLFGIDAHDPEGIKRAAQICRNDIDFGAERIITERLFSGREAYSKWMIQDLYHHLPEGDYTHVLTVHPDGYVQNPSAWRDEWLEWDYIGASWWYKDSMNVGNGGFSLRSKRFIELCSKLELQTYHPEDDVLCRQLRPWFEKEYGIKFAPDDVANRFSIEAYAVPPPHNKYSGQFGYHGYHCTGLPIPPPVRKSTHVSRPASRRR
jgi:glycosyltransferase involved in cell wall biosynthesis